jgi:hypothetical protein
MSKDLQGSAERYMCVVNGAGPRLVSNMGSIIARGDKLTEYHNNNFDTDGRSDISRERLVHMIDEGRFVASLALHYPRILLQGGRMILAARPFERVLHQHLPDTLRAVVAEETDLYGVAEQILGIDGVLSREPIE